MLLRANLQKKEASVLWQREGVAFCAPCLTIGSDRATAPLRGGTIFFQLSHSHPHAVELLLCRMRV